MLLLVNFLLFLCDLVFCLFKFFLFDLWRYYPFYVFAELKEISKSKKSIGKKTIHFIQLLLAIFYIPFGYFILILCGLICDLSDRTQERKIYKLN